MKNILAILILTASFSAHSSGWDYCEDMLSNAQTLEELAAKSSSYYDYKKGVSNWLDNAGYPSSSTGEDLMWRLWFLGWADMHWDEFGNGLTYKGTEGKKGFMEGCLGALR